MSYHKYDSNFAIAINSALHDKRPKPRTGQRPVPFWSFSRLSAHRAPRCDNPVTIVVGAGRQYAPLIRRIISEPYWFDPPLADDPPDGFKYFYKMVEGPLIYQFQVGQHINVPMPCRKCAKCRKFKQWIWASRARREMQEAKRTWFVTFTMHPHHRMLAAVSGDPHAYIKEHVSLWLKRVREESGAKLRYLCAIEDHKDGTPHCHMLIHEHSCPLPKRMIQRHWTLGFSNAKLASAANCDYVTKYIGKDTKGRVRASLKYGHFMRSEACEK